jgi:hypothetical protein
MTAPAIPDSQAPLVLVTERPEGMSYEAYKELQRQQDRLLRARKRGRLVFVASGYEQLTTADGRPVLARRTQTYRKPTPPTP